MSASAADDALRPVGRTATSATAALALMAASGFAALGYQIVWTQQAGLWLGHEATAVLAVVGAFFAGLALGAATLGRRVQASAHPARWYAGCEVAIGLWGLVLVVLMAPAGEALLALTGAQPSPAWQAVVAFAGTFVLLLPATAAMGATLPALERVMAQLAPTRRTLAALYAANTAGAVAGVLAAAFWLVPAVGLVRTTQLCAALNLLCALATLVWLRRPASVPFASAAPTLPRSRHLLPLLAATGLLGIGYEVLVVRVLRQVAENTVYTFAMLLAVYLVGTAIGAAVYQRRAREVGEGTTRTTGTLLVLLALACALGSASLFAADTLKQAFLHTAGPGMAGALAAEALLAVAAFGLPTVVMGALFSHLCLQAGSQGLGFGRALSVNTLGAALAPCAFGVLLAPWLGPKVALLLVVMGYAALAAVVSTRRSRLGALAVGAGAVVLTALAPPLAFVEVPEGGRILSYRDGALGAVSVVKDADGVARLRIDNRQQEGSSATRYADTRQALVPLLLHPAPRQALFLGLGTGVTARAAAQDAQLQVEAVELLPEVIEASTQFADPDDGPSRLRAVTGDARRHVRATDRRYDLIVSDNFHPARSGSASLYTVEHFRAVHERLAPGGLFCQWLPLHQLDLPTLRSIVAAFVEAEPQGMAVLATLSLETPVLGLVARADGSRFDVDTVRQRLRTAALPQPPAAFGLDDEMALLGSIVAGPRALARFAAGAPANRDDHPVVAYLAPRITYAPDSRPRDRLLALLGELRTSPDEVLASTGGDTPARLAAYWQARDRFLAAGRDVQPSRDVRRMLAQVREPLLDVLRTSADFRPAFEPLLQMAVALAPADERGARELLAELDRLRPGRPETAAARQRLDEVRR